MTTIMRLSRLRRSLAPDRLVWSSGKNVTATGIPDRVRSYLSDMYTTLIDIEWRWNLLVFVLGIVLGWVVFACLYYLMLSMHGDLDPVNTNRTDWIPCIVGVSTFTGAYLFSVETMGSIGYGIRYETEECPGVYVLVMLQSVIGTGVQFALASVVVSKMRRAKSHAQTILFSKRAVIFREDDRLKLAVRVADLRKDGMIGAHATGMLVKKTTAKQGHKVPVRMFTVTFEAEGGRQKLFLCWPCLLVHVVDEKSPLWSLSRDQLFMESYELTVVLAGVAATTSKPFQARKSYHSREILWGHQFHLLQVTEDDSGTGSYLVDFTHFHDTLPVTVPSCSAQEFENSKLFGDPDHENNDDEEEQDADDVFMPAETCDREPDGLASPSSPSSATTTITRTAATGAELAAAAAAVAAAVRRGEGGKVSVLPQRGEYLPRRLPTPASSPRHSKFQRPLSFGDALNLYWHRRSVTDTYLGTDNLDEDSDDSEENDAIMSIVSQQSRQEIKPDVRDIVWLPPPRGRSLALEPTSYPATTSDESEAEDV